MGFVGLQIETTDPSAQEALVIRNGGTHEVARRSLLDGKKNSWRLRGDRRVKRAWSVMSMLRVVAKFVRGGKTPPEFDGGRWRRGRESVVGRPNKLMAPEAEGAGGNLPAGVLNPRKIDGLVSDLERALSGCVRALGRAGPARGEVFAATASVIAEG